VGAAALLAERLEEVLEEQPELRNALALLCAAPGTREAVAIPSLCYPTQGALSR
jgi:hypothetical protein